MRKLFLLVSPYQQVDGKCSSFEQTGTRLQAFDLCWIGVTIWNSSIINSVCFKWFWTGSVKPLWYSVPTILNFQQLHFNQVTVQKHVVGLCLRNPDLTASELACAWKCTGTSRLWSDSLAAFTCPVNAALFEQLSVLCLIYACLSSCMFVYIWYYIKALYYIDIRILWHLGAGEVVSEAMFS